MKVLIAEDEPDIGRTYEVALEDRGHEAVVTEDGEECLEIYEAEFNKIKIDGVTSAQPFDVVILDYKMPKKDGMQVAKDILDMNPNQRIIFASAYVKETLEDSVKQLKRVVELLQKPFITDVLVDTVEDKEAYEGLKKLMVGLKEIVKEKTDVEPSPVQIKDLFESLRKIQKGRSF